MGEGLTRAFAAARRTRMCPVEGCRRLKLRGGVICKLHQLEWDMAVATLTGQSPVVGRGHVAGNVPARSPRRKTKKTIEKGE